MGKINKKLTIIKYGSETLVSQNVNGEISIDYNNLLNHGLLINNTNNPVILVSSGAVAFGKTFHNDFNYIKDAIIRKRIFSAIGNPHLSINWDKAIPNKLVLQSLITHRDLMAEDSKEKISEIVSALYQEEGAIIQVNDNDFVTDEELKEIRGGDFGDNDKTAALLAKLCGELFDEVEVVINTSSDGVVENDKIIPALDASKLTDDYIEELCGANKTNLGTGGMRNKLKIIRDLIMATRNTTVHIINGKQPTQLKQLLSGESAGTKICR